MGSVSNSYPNAAALRDCSQGICSIYCPQWCYILYSPPPPSIILGNDTEDNSSGFEFSPLIVAIIGILASTFILVTYYTIISKLCRHRHRLNDPTDGNNELVQISSSANSGLDEALIKSITVYKYQKSGGLVEGNDCSVCLSEFEENENLRLLPKCNHAFHLPCIDTWLKSHSTCPLCRSTIICPNPSMEPPPSVSINALEYRQRSSDVVVIIQSSELESSQQQVVVRFGPQVLPKLPVEDGETMNQTRASVTDILNDSEDDVELLI